MGVGAREDPTSGGRSGECVGAFALALILLHRWTSSRLHSCCRSLRGSADSCSAVKVCMAGEQRGECRIVDEGRQ